MNNQQTIPLVMGLEDASATLERVGGKGASLARLAVAGLPVPPGFHITTAAYRRFVEEHGLQEAILAAVAAANPTDPMSLEVASQQIGALFANSAMPDEIGEAIRRAYAQLGGAELPVAVRSSATAEDLPEMSFAGQQETYLNMRGEAQVLDAVKRCWASLWTARAIGYRARHTIAPQDVSLAVVVQQLVPADAAGILFTANPLTGGRDQVMINAAWGLGEAIVGGQVTPDTIVVDKASGAITQQEISEKDVMTVRTPDGTHEEAVPVEKRKLPVLSAEQAPELARIGVHIEELYGQPMDIEWALQDGQIFVVQARPITALPDPASSPGSTSVGSPPLRGPVSEDEEWPLPHPKGRYMRSSVFELLPEPLSPLFATLGLPALTRSMNALMEQIRLKGVMAEDFITTINGYGYYNLTLTAGQSVKMVLLLPVILGRDMAPLMRTAQSRWQHEHDKYAELVTRWQSAELASTSATDLFGGVRDITVEALEYYLSIQSGILPAAYLSELFFTLFYNKLIKRRDDPTALTFMLGFESTPIRAEESLYDLAQWVREQPELAAVLAKMSSAEFDTAYQDGNMAGVDEEVWAQFRQRFATHLATFGDAIYDLDFAKSVPAEDPSSFLETLKFFLSGAAPDPHVRQQTTAATREQAVQTILKRLRGMRLSWFRKLLGWAQNMAPLREDALADVGLGWPILRQMLREIGRRLTITGAIGTPDDIFWLTEEEIEGAVTALDAGATIADSHAVVAERRATWERERTLIPPSALPRKEGARFLGIDFSRMMPARLDQPEGDLLKGIAASPGQVTGVARVIAGPAEFDQMRQGDILVARITTPAWTPLFALAAGVVTDVGGPLSHSSIVAREYHIPAVLGTGAATERLSSGQRITVDGDAGTVTVVR